MTQSRKLAAIMFTDMVGYSALSQKDEELALALLEEHRTLLRPLFPLHNGTEIKTIGDAFLVEFASAVEAANCAIAIQKSLVSHNSTVPVGKRILLRIGLHIGDVVMDGDDVLGDGVNIAARIEPLAEPGGICVTEDVAHQIRNKIDGGLKKLGERKLKNIEDSVTVYKLVLPWETGKTDSGPSALIRSVTAPLSLERLKSRWAIIAAGLIAMALIIWEPWGGSEPAGEIRSIAVLPLENLMNDPEQLFFVEGMHEALTAELSRISALRVIGRTSTLGYTANHRPIQEIAEILNVDAVIEGSVFRDGGRVRITVQLVATKPERHLWSEVYDRDLRDILKLHSDVARAIVEEIKVTLIPAEEGRLTTARPVDPKAYGLYLKGRYESARWTVAAERRAIDYFQQSIQVDPSYAPAHAGLSIAYIILSQPLNGMDNREGMPLARAAAERGVELDPELSEVYYALGAVHYYYDWDWETAEKELRRAAELNPSSAEVRSLLGFTLSYMGRSGEAIPELERALELAPLAFDTRVVVAQGFYNVRAFERAIADCRSMLELEPAFNHARFTLRMNYEALGRFEEAIETYAEGRLRADSSAGTLEEINEFRRAFDTRGPRGYWEWLLEYGDPFQSRAAALAALHRVDELLALLEQWYEERSILAMGLHVPRYDPVRDEPWFQDLLKKRGLD